MNELKEHLFVPHSELQEGDELTYVFTIAKSYYLKSEADKVISEKDKEIAKLKESIGKLLKSKTEQIMDEVLEKVVVYGEGFVPVEHAMKLVAELRHHKYKRCLAMYRYCAIKALYELDFKGNDVEWKWYSKWMHKWFELAEKFKEAK